MLTLSLESPEKRPFSNLIQLIKNNKKHNLHSINDKYKSSFKKQILKLNHLNKHPRNQKSELLPFQKHLKQFSVITNKLGDKERIIAENGMRYKYKTKNAMFIKNMRYS